MLQLDFIPKEFHEKIKEIVTGQGVSFDTAHVKLGYKTSLAIIDGSLNSKELGCLHKLIEFIENLKKEII